MRIAIVDDDIDWRERIQNEIAQYDKNNENQIDTFPSGEKYLDSKNHYDMVFLDFIENLIQCKRILKQLLDYIVKEILVV